MPLLRCENLSFAYENKVVLTDVNFSLNEGDYLCVVGSNGSGKSTLIKGMLGIKSPAKGRIYFDEIKANQIGYLPQQSNIQRDFPASVMEVVLSGCIPQLGFRPFYSKDEKKSALKTLDRLQASDLAEKSYQELSGGQQQRVLLARTLVTPKKLLILDEPAAGLDPRGINELYEIIADINLRYNVSVMMVSHDVGKAVSQASRVLHLAGRQKFFGSSSDYQNSSIGKLYLSEGVDYDAF